MSQPSETTPHDLQDATLARDDMGRLVLTDASGQRLVGVMPVRAFPIQAPESGIALLSTDGHEAAWIDDLAALPQPKQQLVREELAQREFMPEITQLRSVSSYATPSTWAVHTNRGDTELVLRGEEDIRRLGADMLLITDSHGIQFLVRNINQLGRESRKILDRFL
jgi:spore germination protein YaaH